MRSIGTVLVATFELDANTHIAATWDGGPDIILHVEIDHTLARATAWSVWNPVWGTTLIDFTRDSFERYVANRLSEPGVADELVAAAAA
jgi:hypothetical protein